MLISINYAIISINLSYFLITRVNRKQLRLKSINHTVLAKNPQGFIKCNFTNLFFFILYKIRYGEARKNRWRWESEELQKTPVLPQCRKLKKKERILHLADRFILGAQMRRVPAEAAEAWAEESDDEDEEPAWNNTNILHKEKVKVIADSISYKIHEFLLHGHSSTLL